MPSIRRPKPLKGKLTLDDVIGLDLGTPLDGDLIVYDSTDAVWKNTKNLTGDYTIAGTLSASALTATGVLSGATLSLSGNATIVGSLTAAVLNAPVANIGTLNLSTALSIPSLTLAGSLTGVGFSFSGSGTIAGSLTVGGAIAATGALSGASLTVTGVITGQSLLLSGNANVVGNITSLGTIAGASVVGSSVSGTTGAFGELAVGGATYTENGITFADDTTSIDILNGATTILSLRTAGIIEGTGDPNGQITANPGSLFLRTDGQDPSRTLYLKAYPGTAGWRAIEDRSSDID